MAYDPLTGEYKERDDSVEKRITGLLSKDNDYMKQAATTGLHSANRRGLLNSSIGVQAAEAARVGAVLPIAQQEAGQSHERNVQGRGLQMQDIGQRRDIGSREKMQGLDIENSRFLQGRDITSREGMQDKDIGNSRFLQGRDITSQQYMQGRDITSREGMQTLDLAAMRERLTMELGSREYLQAAELAAQKENLGMQLSQEERLALADLRAAEERLGMELSSREGMQERDITSREGMQERDITSREGMHDRELDERGLDRDANERIANLNVSSDDRRAAASMAQSFEVLYSNEVTAIMNNADLPPAERQLYLDRAASRRDNNLALVEQFFGVDLEWDEAGTSSSGASTEPGGPSTGPGGDRYGPRMYR